MIDATGYKDIVIQNSGLNLAKPRVTSEEYKNQVPVLFSPVQAVVQYFIPVYKVPGAVLP